MRDAQVNGRIVQAGPKAPDLAVCPDCGVPVRKRSRRGLGQTVTWFYRHQHGNPNGADCPRRYRPVRY